jgi:GNAT superfamily N-acetyltransferase
MNYCSVGKFLFMTILIREAICSDAPSIARVHVASWQTTYRAILPPVFLDNLSVTTREKYWTDLLCAEQCRDCVYVAEHESQIVGFASGGTERTEKYDSQGELYAIYLLADQQGKGIGRQLVGAVARWLAQADMHSMLVWVLKDNTARKFYEKLGGEAVAAQLITIGGVTVEETGYRWSDITSLIGKL